MSCAGDYCSSHSRSFQRQVCSESSLEVGLGARVLDGDGFPRGDGFHRGGGFPHGGGFLRGENACQKTS